MSVGTSDAVSIRWDAKVCVPAVRCLGAQRCEHECVVLLLQTGAFEALGSAKSNDVIIAAIESANTPCTATTLLPSLTVAADGSCSIRTDSGAVLSSTNKVWAMIFPQIVVLS